MPQVDENTKKQRVSKLRFISKEVLQELMQEKNGRKIKVLFESTNLSYTDDFFKVKIKNNTNKELNKGEIIEVKILNNNENFLKAIV
jgi:tRNA A37 methylthiotransferase MiaB